VVSFWFVCSFYINYSLDTIRGKTIINTTYMNSVGKNHVLCIE